MLAELISFNGSGRPSVQAKIYFTWKSFLGGPGLVPPIWILLIRDISAQLLPSKNYTWKGTHRREGIKHPLLRTTCPPLVHIISFLLHQWSLRMRHWATTFIRIANVRADRERFLFFLKKPYRSLTTIKQRNYFLAFLRKKRSRKRVAVSWVVCPFL